MVQITTINIIGGKSDKDLSNLKDGRYILYSLEEGEERDVFYYQRLYGALKNTLYKEGETGYTPKEIHELIKITLLPEMWQINKNLFFKESQSGHEWSTRYLTLEGWKHYIEEFKIFAQEHFNCYI